MGLLIGKIIPTPPEKKVKVMGYTPTLPTPPKGVLRNSRPLFLPSSLRCPLHREETTNLQCKICGGWVHPETREMTWDEVKAGYWISLLRTPPQNWRSEVIPPDMLPIYEPGNPIPIHYVPNKKVHISGNVPLVAPLPPCPTSAHTVSTSREIASPQERKPTAFCGEVHIPSTIGKQPQPPAITSNPYK